MGYERKISASMLEKQKIGCALEIKSLEENGRFAGYASVFHVVDNQRDIIERGAFAESLSGRECEIKLLWQHQPAEPIGVFDRIFEDKLGLYVEGRLLLGVQKAREAYALLKEGAVSGLSIGYSPVRYTVDPESGIRRLHSVQLWEVSLVTFPANSGAQVTVVKNCEVFGDGLEAERKSGALLRFCEAVDRAIEGLSR